MCLTDSPGIRLYLLLTQIAMHLLRSHCICADRNASAQIAMHLHNLQCICIIAIHLSVGIRLHLHRYLCMYVHQRVHCQIVARRCSRILDYAGQIHTNALRSTQMHAGWGMLPHALWCCMYYISTLFSPHNQACQYKTGHVYVTYNHTTQIQPNENVRCALPTSLSHAHDCPCSWPWCYPSNRYVRRTVRNIYNDLATTPRVLASPPEAVQHPHTPCI